MYLVIFFILTALLSLTGMILLLQYLEQQLLFQMLGLSWAQLLQVWKFFNITDISKWILTLGMILGRLELFAILVLFFLHFGEIKNDRNKKTIFF